MKINKSLLLPASIIFGCFVFIFIAVKPASAACSAPGKCVSNAVCVSANGTMLPGSSCANPSDICCVYQAQTQTTCTGLTQSTPCSSKGGLEEVPDGETAACPSGASFDGCSSKPSSGSGVVLCCYHPENASSGSTCTPETSEPNFSYLCLTTEACTQVSGSPIKVKTGSQQCTGLGGQKEVCCKAPSRTGQTVTDNTTPAAAKTYYLTNPLGTSDLRVIAGRAINTFLGIVGALALLVFVYAGVTYMIAGGQSQSVDKAKATMKYAVVGICMIAFAYVLTDSFIALWTKDLVVPESASTAAGIEASTQAEQEVTSLVEQQQAAQQAEDQAKAQAKSQKADICGQTTATAGYSCLTLDASEQKDYNCLSGYCQSQSASNYICCKKK